MADRYLIYGELPPNFTSLRLAGPTFVVIGPILTYPNRISQIAAAVAGLAVTIIVELLVYFLHRRRLWIALQPEGFVLYDRGGERTIRDLEIEALAYAESLHAENGRLRGLTRIGSLWLADSSVIRLKYTYAMNDGDPLAPLFQRIMTRLRTHCEDELRNGRVVQGKTWRLSNREFCTVSHGTETACPVSQIAAVGNYGPSLAIWRRGDEKPAYLIPLESKNAWLLPLLLAPCIGPSDEIGGLGRILIERTVNREITNLWIGGGLLSFFGGLSWIFFFWNDNGILGFLVVVAAIALVLSPVFAIGGLYGALMQFRCHQRGVFKRDLWGKRQILYSEITSFTYSATCHYHGLSYEGTALELAFSDGKSKIEHYEFVNFSDEELSGLRDLIAAAAAVRILGRIASGDTVPWTNRLTLRQDGVLIHSSGIFWKAEPVLLAFDDCSKFNIEGGVFSLWRTGEVAAAFSQRVSATNFFLGLHAFTELLEQHRASSCPACSGSAGLADVE